MPDNTETLISNAIESAMYWDLHDECSHFSDSKGSCRAADTLPAAQRILADLEQAGYAIIKVGTVPEWMERLETYDEMVRCENAIYTVAEPDTTLRNYTVDRNGRLIEEDS